MALVTGARARRIRVHPRELTILRLRGKPPAAWYFGNGGIYVDLLRERYGRRARGVIRQTYKHLAGVAMHEALRRLDAGDRRGALSWWLFAIRLSPALMADKQLAGRIFRVRNLRRLGRIFLSNLIVSKGSSHK